MYNINVIFTRHRQLGMCNFEELFKIITALKPQVIFEELSFGNFSRSYEQNKLFTVETNAIKLYRFGSLVDQVPVDTYNLPRNYDEDKDHLLDAITRNNTLTEISSFLDFLDTNTRLVGEEGFAYLNSNRNDDFFEQYHLLKDNILRILNDERLFSIDRMIMDVDDKRENEMLANIYSYSKNNQFDHGLFFIGSGHRKAILAKIKVNSQAGHPKLNWIFHGSD